MSGSCKLLFVILYFVYALNLVSGHPKPSDDNDQPGPLDSKEEPIPAQPQRPGEILKLKGNKDKDGSSPNDDDEKGDSNEEPNEKNDEDAGEKEVNEDDGVKNDNKTKLKEKESLFKEQNFMMEDDAASLNWPLGIVPYYLDSSVFDFIVAYNLRKAMDLIESVSCIRFKTLMLMPSEGQNFTWINITNPTKQRECVHEPEERQEGQIVMVLGFDCMKQKQILHTLLHAIGFKDEVTHPLRDQYIHILWDNIQQQYLHLFRSVPSEVALRATYEYDPASIMHFHDRAFSKNGQATLQALLPGLQIGPSDTLSALDKLKLRLMFNRECNKRNVIGLQESCKNVMSKDQKLNLPDDDPRDIIETLKTHGKKQRPEVDDNRAKKERMWGKPGDVRPTSKKPKKPRTTTNNPQEDMNIKDLLEDDKLRTSEENL